MPKIIENLRTRLTEEARRQIERSGYSAVTIRSVATACGVGTGTVYNYFPSKDALLAAYMLQDWNDCIEAVNSLVGDAQTPAPIVRCIYDQLRAFTEQHTMIIRDEAAIAGFSGAFSRYHVLLRRQLADPLRRFCRSEFEADFIAEALLTWTMANRSFDEIYDIISKLF